jgi:hypothetical protein
MGRKEAVENIPPYHEYNQMYLEYTIPIEDRRGGWLASLAPLSK